MKVSVIIPVHNRERYIPTAIRSLLAQQDDADLDIIVIDDGSHDATVEIVSGLAADAPNIRLFQQGHGGVSAARNHGLSRIHPEAELVTFLDSDDVSVPGRFATELPLFREDSALDMTYSRMTLSNAIDDGAFASQPDARTCTLRGISLSTAIIRRDAIAKVGGFDEALKQSEDLDFLLRLFELPLKVRFLDHVSVLYRRHESNITRNKREARKHLSLALLRSAQRRRKAGSLTQIPGFFDTENIVGDRELLLW